MKHPMVTEFLKILHTSDAITGENGQGISPTNPPAWKAGDLDEIRQIGQHFCCAEMTYHVRMGHVAFGSRKEEAYHNKVAEVFIRVENGARVLPGGNEKAKLNTDIAIAYCPWCREAVMTMEISLSNGDRTAEV
jgi:hypothetical protein